MNKIKVVIKTSLLTSPLGTYLAFDTNDVLDDLAQVIGISPILLYVIRWLESLFENKKKKKRKREKERKN